MNKILTTEIDSLWSRIFSEQDEDLKRLSEPHQQMLKQALALSPFFGDCLLKDKAYFIDWLQNKSYLERPDFEAIQQQLEESLNNTTNLVLAKQLLRQWRRRCMAHIAFRDVLGLSEIEQDFADISYCAELLVRQAYDWLMPGFCKQWGEPFNRQGERQNLLILAMGKFGGRELNFSSDIDLIFFYQTDGETQNSQRKLAHQTFFIRLGQQLIALLAEVTRDGFVYRVDMRLRPYGDGGPLAMSFDAAEDYYQEQGREWERFALIKARLLTGRAEEQRQFYEMIRPFVFRRYIDFGVLESIREMKTMIEQEVRRKGLKNNIKLGAGGIREAEFIAQALQLVRGGRLPELQERHFLSVLPLLEQEQLLPKGSGAELSQAYLFLRRTEHLIQAMYDQQTQTLPDKEMDQLRLATALAFETYEAFLIHLDYQQQTVRRHFSAVFEASVSNEPDVESLPDIMDDDFIQQLFGSVNEDEQRLLTQEIEAFTAMSLSDQARKRLLRFLPQLLTFVGQQENPRQVLQRLFRLLKSIVRRSSYLVLLAENPPVLEHLVRLCSQSFWISERLAEFPMLLDELLYPNSLYHPLSKQELVEELNRQLLRVEPDDEEQQQEQLRIFKQTNELRVAAAFLNDTIDIKMLSRLLSGIAEAVVLATMRLAWHQLCHRYGVPQIDGASPDCLRGFAVVGYGKLGGEELGFGSDLDIVFLYDAEPESETLGKKPITHSLFFTRLAQRIIHMLSVRTMSGVLYEVDTRLRPSGNSGLLVSHIEAFHDYQEESAWTWEHQALLRARVVGDDSTLNERFNEIRRLVVQRNRDEQQLRDQVIDMRIKMRQNLDKSTEDSFDIKQGSGGMVDIEFIAQYLILKHGHCIQDEEIPSRTTQLFRLLEHLETVAEDDVELLNESYRWYRRQVNLNLLTGAQVWGEKDHPVAKQLKQHQQRVKEQWSQWLET
ncbi:bifunctional [glutamate--ammonia ligase]-adenylyl-L-tyrosine phosphorylase/[glutamate--ammonia-ligase] adenylyltransferase [Pleionea sp. CnH1-48]|uniref:bifunctional [glutamate--ammonia ligase]-adenylyl-L-tyrosine phosphorylase/[glutamate--ammonia-ligase] adenylyltransferase n=1 Tax=Pleionea sp. CnH1-48 TaxID=2954494 RepID=UPI0020976911|nr:bifunctional [glutamate--ammonia ligase]-adenylyl-L-tyrosine phosphorylase/[glutamate--ammonia-ligase] adenylyltransferase [Pleionea sp. CnH1-48]MCO7225666.1 bifunctional [glutamate--ammonia ligase]-adenylyl-L-tyrosine phosphorylase/[glutamate--ammonia-ligase] adenylyltransferase [Pleionea sp. CnH1-48]